MNYEKVMSDAAGTAEFFINEAISFIKVNDFAQCLNDELKVQIIKIYVEAAINDQHTILNQH